MFDPTIFTNALTSLAAYAAAVVFVSEFIFGRLLKFDGLKAKWATLALATLAGAVLGFFKLGIFATAIGGAAFLAGVLVIDPVRGAVIGFVGGVLATGVFSFDTVKMILVYLQVRVPLPADKHSVDSVVAASKVVAAAGVANVVATAAAGGPEAVKAAATKALAERTRLQ